MTRFASERPDWYDYADEQAARETEGKRQRSFAEWCAEITMSREERRTRAPKEVF